MIFLLKLAAISILGIISYQDFKERMVHWFLFPMAGITLGFIHYLNVQVILFVFYVVFNMLLISLILLILFFYTKFIRKRRFLNTSFGLGDLLFFYSFSTGFPIFTFAILFVFSIFFSLLSFLIFKQNMKYETVPLAGFQSLFLIFVLSYSVLFKSPSLYNL